MQLGTWVWHSCELDMDREFHDSFEADFEKYFSGKITYSQANTTHLPISMTVDRKRITGVTKELNHYDDHSVLRAQIGNTICMAIDNVLSIEYSPDQWLSITLPKEEMQNKFLREYVMRTVRTYVDKILIDAGFAFFHLWAVKIWGKTIVISWEKGAGKTTSVIIAMEQFWAQYIANDRVWWKWSEEGLHITEREGDTKIWAATIENSPILRNFNAQKDHKTAKFHYPQVFTLFWSGERTISWVSEHIFCPHILGDSNTEMQKISCPDDVLFNSFEEPGLWFNQYRALFGKVPRMPARPPYNVIKDWIESYGLKGISQAFHLFANP